MKKTRTKMTAVEEEYFVCDICGNEFEFEDWCQRHMFSEHVGYDNPDEFGEVILRNGNYVYYLHTDTYQVMKFELFADEYEYNVSNAQQIPFDEAQWVKDQNGMLTAIVKQLRTILNMQAGIDSIDEMFEIHPMPTIKETILDMCK